MTRFHSKIFTMFPLAHCTSIQGNLSNRSVCQGNGEQCQVSAGSILDGHPPLFLGLYVDDFVYFSAARVVEEHFEALLLQSPPVDLLGIVSRFLGIRLDWTFSDDGHVSVSLSQPSYTTDLPDAVTGCPALSLIIREYSQTSPCAEETCS
jgi:hypothetical protein